MDKTNESFEKTLETLGLKASALRGMSKEKLKKAFKAAYRREIKRNHPDTAKSQVGTESESERAENSRKIIEIYDTIVQALEIPDAFEAIARWINTHSEPLQEQEIRNEYILDGMTIQFPKIGFAASTFNGKDIYESLVKFYSGEDIEEINNWLREQKHTDAWKLGRNVNDEGKETGSPKILINPYQFDWRYPIQLGKVVNWFTQDQEYNEVQPGEYIDVRHCFEDYRGRLRNVRICNFLKPEELRKLLDATERLAQYTAYDGNIPSLWQSYTRNVLLGLEDSKKRELGYSFSLDFEPYDILSQRGKEGQSMWRRESQPSIAMIESPRSNGIEK